MAGAGYKLFQTGDVLTAAQVNTYLNEQTVMVFANAAARTSALTSVLAEGMMSYLQDTNSVEVYNGSSWVNVGNAGDITEVQAGTGISIASGTGPIPVITNTATTTIDAEGDLLVGDAADALQRLAIGSNGNVLTVDTSVDGKIKWAAPAGGGKVLQVVQSTSTSITSNSTNTFADATGLSVTITPSSATSKVLIQLTHQIYMSSADALNALELRILRGATNIHKYGTELGQVNTGVKKQLQASAIYLDSPATTSATTYKVQFANYINGASVAINDPASTMVMIATEIGA